MENIREMNSLGNIYPTWCFSASWICGSVSDICLVHTFFLSFLCSSLSDIPIHVDHVCYSCPVVLDVLFRFFCLCSLCFSVWEVSAEIASLSEVPSSALSSLPISQRHSSLLLQCFCYCFYLWNFFLVLS